MNRTCSRCDGDIAKPTDRHAAYVRAEDFVEEEAVDEHVAFVAPEGVRDELSEVAAMLAEVDHPVGDPDATWFSLAQAILSNTPTAAHFHPAADIIVEDLPDPSAFERVGVRGPEHAKSLPGFVKTEVVKSLSEVQKTGLVHTDCVDENDDVIWGPNS